MRSKPAELFAVSEKALYACGQSPPCPSFVPAGLPADNLGTGRRV